MSRVGQQIGNYRLLKLLGEGGFAEVYLGEHVFLKTHAAIKILHAYISPNEQDSFVQEAQTIARLRHSHIVRVLDFGIDGAPFLVMDYLSKGSLRQLHPKGSVVPLPTVVSYVKQVASALQYAHDARLIHRDVKPENMLVGDNNEVILSDFGIAVVAHSTSSFKTLDNSGTPHYMAPEHINGKPRPASDQYALGIVIYEWLSGTRPYEGGSLIELAMQHLTAPLPPLREKISDISAEVEEVILRALNKDPQLRFASIKAFANALEQAALPLSGQAEQKQDRSYEVDYKQTSNAIIGIDLGTTNSRVAIRENGKYVMLPNAEGARSTPSVVAIDKHGQRLVGEVAKRQAITNPEQTILSIKRLIGCKYNSPQVERDRRLVPYKVIRANNGDAWVEIHGKQYSPQEITAMILQKLKTDAEAYLGRRVTQAVISVPAHFNDPQRRATRDAGQIAGFEVLQIINEPTSAALFYGLDKKNERIAVYSFGGSAFDISILELHEGLVKVLSTTGDMHLGGDNFDQRIINWLSDEFRRENGIDLRLDRMALQRLKEAAEKAKKELSSLMQTEINLPFITADASGPKHLNISLSRSKLEQLVADLLQKLQEYVYKALAEAGVSAEYIQGVVLVGGQTRMPAVQAMVRRIFERAPIRSINPDEVVAMGAAIQAGILTGEIKGVRLQDVVPISLGIETLGGVFTPMIKRNTPLPTQQRQVFSTATDNQPSVEINILQGEQKMARDNHSLGSFILDGIPPAPRGVPQIEVTFDIDANGIVSVSARDKSTGREQKVTVVASSGLSKNQVERLVREAGAQSQQHQVSNEAGEQTGQQQPIGTGNNVQASPKDQGGYSSINDLFEELFAKSAKKPQSGPATDPKRGGDIKYDLTIAFEEAVFGCKKEITLARWETCSTCRGNGTEPGKGTKSCGQCRGQGRVRNNRRVIVNIPAGVDDGINVRVTGEGDVSTKGGTPGNLYVILTVKPHPFFKRQGNDIIFEQSISFEQAAYGAEVEVPTVDGKTAKLKIPPGTQSGTSFRLKNLGAPVVHSTNRGDYLVIVKVLIPKLDS